MNKSHKIVANPLCQLERGWYVSGYVYRWSYYEFDFYAKSYLHILNKRGQLYVH